MNQFHQLFRSFQGFGGVGKKVTRVGVDFQFQPVRSECFACHLRGKYGFFGSAHAGSIGQKLDMRMTDMFQHIVFFIIQFYTTSWLPFTISVPDARMDCSMISLELNFPVPKNRRELNSRPAMINFSISFLFVISVIGCLVDFACLIGFRKNPLHLFHRIIRPQHRARKGDARNACLHDRRNIGKSNPADSDDRQVDIISRI